MELCFKKRPFGCPFCIHFQQTGKDTEEFTEVICNENVPEFEDYPANEIGDFKFFCPKYMEHCIDENAWKKENLYVLGEYNTLWNC